MQVENISFILERLRYLGFGEKLGLPARLTEAIKSDPQDIELEADIFFGETCRLEVILYFHRSEQHMTYFFNKYLAKIFYIDSSSLNKSQTFYIDKGRGVTVREAYNLLQGRAVNRNFTTAEGEVYNAWIQLNFDEITTSGNYKVERYGSAYGFDLENTLAKYPIRELLVDTLKQTMLKSLKKGNLHPVSMVQSTKVQKWLVAADPKYKMIRLYPVNDEAEYDYAAAGHDMAEVSMPLASVAEPPLPWDPSPDRAEGDEGEEGEEDVDDAQEGSLTIEFPELQQNKITKRNRKPLKRRK